MGNYECPKNRVCGNIEDYPSIKFATEKVNQKSYLNYGITNYDHLGGAMLTVFQMITSETWYYQIMNLMDVDLPFLGAFYVFLIIIVGQFFLLNLLLAVIIQASIQ
jgi:Ion transport protein